MSNDPVHPPFTERFVFSGPNIAISCAVEYDKEQECYIATSDHGFRGAADSADGAALACFEAWMTGRRGWFVPPSEEAKLDRRGGRELPDGGSYCRDCWKDASFQPPEVTRCLECGGVLVWVRHSSEPA